jgi:hypothetical protein
MYRLGRYSLGECDLEMSNLGNTIWDVQLRMFQFGANSLGNKNWEVYNWGKTQLGKMQCSEYNAWEYKLGKCSLGVYIQENTGKKIQFGCSEEHKELDS